MKGKRGRPDISRENVLESVSSTPFPQRDDEYGIPTLTVDTDDEVGL